MEKYLQTEHSMGYMGTDDDMPEDYERWLSTMETDVLIQYADDYAKECVRDEQHRIRIGIIMKMKEKYDVIYEECIDVIDSK